MFKAVGEKLEILGTFAGPKRFRLAATVLVALAAALILFWLLDRVILFYFARSYVDEIGTVVGLNRNVAIALSWVVFALWAFFIGSLFSFSRWRRRSGLAGIFVLLVGQPLIIFLFDRPFDIAGNAQKCYVITRDSIKYGEQVGRDPATGLECKKLTPEIAEQIEEYRSGRRPRRIASSESPVFFSLRTGNPVIWYSTSKDGLVEAFDLMGFNPETGEELKPINKDTAELWKEQSRAPERIEPGDDYDFFDPVTGKSRVWFRRDASRNLELYNRAGFHRKTGEKLLPIDASVISDWKAAKTKKCYVLVKNSVKYGNVPGIDAETGRQCRTFTADMLERLKEYEQGNRPKRVDALEPLFFDQRSGEPALWYAVNSKNRIDLFTLMGFHPETGTELLPVNQDIVARWKAEQVVVVARTPQRVDPNSYVFFDPKSGAPRVWFWRGGDGSFEFYDAAGFHPRTGNALVQLSKIEAQRLKKEADDAKASIEAAAAKTLRENQDRAAELAKASEAGRTCDELAANPNDSMRAADGVPFDAVKGKATEALASCEAAVRQNPNEYRYQYQLARVLQLSDRKRSTVILQKLVERKYPAAFDNLGWIAYTDRKRPEEAVALFRKGVELNDSDSMVSLAEMVDRGHAQPRGNWEQKVSLYSKAADLGHQAAKRALEVEQGKQDEAKVTREQQIQQQRLAAEVFGQIVGNMMRR